MINHNNMADQLEKQLAEAPDGAVIVLPEGDIVLERKVRVKNKRNITVKGNRTTILTAFDPHIGFYGYKGAFGFEGCCGITLENLTFDTTVPVNSAGKVTAVDVEGLTFDMKLYEDCQMDGSQTIFALTSIDKEGTPDHLLYVSCENKTLPYDIIGDGTIRIHCVKSMKRLLARLPLGEDMCIRYGIGHFSELENSAITFRSCIDTTLRDITVHSSAGYMIVVFPRCHNMTVERYRVVVPEGSSRLMASNIDALHILGLSGKLTMKDCCFDGLGDDALNIHSTAGTVTAVDGNTVTLINGRHSIPLEEEWCKKGDIIAAYNSDFLCRGHIRVEEYQNSRITGTLLDGSFEVGDVVGNTAFYAQAEIVGCTVKNSRVRALLFQTENITVRDCYFFGIARPAILMAPDVKIWHEMGPVRNALIENCVFEKCPASLTEDMWGAVVLKTSHNAQSESDNIVHRNITVKNNIFRNVPTDILFAASVDGLYMEGNIIEGGKHGDGRDPKKAVKLFNCSNVNIR